MYLIYNYATYKVNILMLKCQQYVTDNAEKLENQKIFTQEECF